MQLFFKFKGLLLKPKPKIFFLNIFFEFFNVHISHLALHSMINMALKWHHKNISNNFTIFIKFWRLPNMLLVRLIVTTPIRFMDLDERAINEPNATLEL